MSQEDRSPVHTGGDFVERLEVVEKKQIELEGEHHNLRREFNDTVKTMVENLSELKEVSKQIVGISQDNKTMIMQEKYERQLAMSEMDKKFSLADKEQDLKGTQNKLGDTKEKIQFYQKWQFWAITVVIIEAFNIGKDFFLK